MARKGKGSDRAESSTGDDIPRHRDRPTAVPDDVETISGSLSLPESSMDDADLPKVVEVGGSIGVKLGVVSIGLAIVGVVAASVHVQPFGNVAIVLSLVLISIAMVLGMLFQAYAFDWSTVRN